MRKTAFGITLLLLYGVTFAQESAKIVEVPQVSIKDSLFYQMIYSVVNDAKNVLRQHCYLVVLFVKSTNFKMWNSMIF